MKSPSEVQILLAQRIADTLSLDFPKGDYEFTYQDYKNFGYCIGEVHEVTSEDICLALSLFSMTDKIEFSYKIKED